MERQNQSYEVIILQLAEEDLQSIFEYYFQEAPEMLDTLVSEYDKTIEHLETTPLLFSKTDGTFRRILIQRFKLFVYYRVIRDKKLIVIEAIMHTSREPNIWKRIYKFLRCNSKCRFYVLTHPSLLLNRKGLVTF